MITIATVKKMKIGEWFLVLEEGISLLYAEPKHIYRAVFLGLKAENLEPTTYTAFYGVAGADVNGRMYFDQNNPERCCWNSAFLSKEDLIDAMWNQLAARNSEAETKIQVMKAADLQGVVE